VLAGTLVLGASAPSIVLAQESGGYLGYDTPSFAAGQSVVVQTDDGGGLSLRLDASADAEKLAALRDGAVVEVVDGPYYDGYGNGWYLVTDGSLRAFAYAGFLVAGSQQAESSSQQAAVSSQSGPASSGYLGHETPSFGSGQTVVVSTDDGGGLSLRLEPSVSAEKLDAAADGSTLTVVDGPYYDDAGNGWYLVSNGPLRAFAYAGFLVAGSQQPAVSSQDEGASTSSSGNLGYETPAFVEGQAVVVQTDDGGGLSLRMEPSLSGEKISAARDGAALTIVLGPQYDDSGNGWYLVSDGSIRAWAYAGFLTAGSQQSAVSSQDDGAAAASSGNLGYETPSFSEGQTVVVRTDDGGGLSLRMEPSVTSDKLLAVGDGTSLRVVQGPVYDGSSNGWYLVTNGSIRAYAFAGFLAAGSDQQTGATSQSGSPASSGYLGYDTPQFSAGQRVEVRTDDGGGLSLRLEPSTTGEKLRALSDGATVSIVEGPVYDGANNGWYLVTDGSIRAFAYAGFLVASSQQPAASSQNEGATSSSSGTAVAFAIGDTATTFGTTNVRNGATATGSLLGTFSEGEIVEITDGPFTDRSGAPWYYIVGDAVQGFVKGEFLVAAAAAAAEQTSGDDGGFIYPLARYTFTQGYGCSSYGFYPYNASWGCRVHNGIDLAAPAGTPIMAAAAGTVDEAGWCDCGLGYYVKIDHGNGLATYYGHMASQPYVSAGQSVDQGESIGPVGSTGLSTGPHTHFMVQRNGVTVDPMDYL
jgi:murein DD-endopeptidase MepM/ murein hydrolase activator NlpD